MYSFPVSEAGTCILIHPTNTMLSVIIDAPVYENSENNYIAVIRFHTHTFFITHLKRVFSDTQEGVYIELEKQLSIFIESYSNLCQELPSVFVENINSAIHLEPDSVEQIIEKCEEHGLPYHIDDEMTIHYKIGKHSFSISNHPLFHYNGIPIKPLQEDYQRHTVRDDNLSFLFPICFMREHKLSLLVD
jgi:hypothetical protein